MNRVGLLEIEVIDFDKEVKISLQIKQHNKLIDEPINAKLSSNSEIPTLYQQWRDSYESLKKKLQKFRGDDFDFVFDDLTENIANPSLILNDEIEVLKQSLNNTLTALKQSLKTWFQSQDESLLKIKQKINEELQQANDFQVLLKTQDELLCKLPWQLENFLEIPNRNSLEVGLTFPEQQQITKITIPKKKDKVRVLVVLGNSKGINNQRDKEILERFDDVEAVFLNQPSEIEFVKRLRDEKGWDIFLFSGHTKTKQQEGLIYINENNYITINDFKNSLEVAITQGLELMIFNSCDGIGLAFDLAKTRLLLPVMLIMKEPIPDVVAQAFLQEFLNEYSTVQYNDLNIKDANVSQSLYTSVSKVRVYLQQYWEKEFPGVSTLPLIFQNPAFSPPIWQEFICEVKAKRLLKSIQKNIGFETLETANKLDNWGTFFRDVVPQYNQARILFEKALEIRQKLLGNEDLAIAESLENIAEICDAQEKFAEAELKYQKALEIRQKLLGDNHPDFASNLYNLGSHYDTRKRHNESLEFYKKSLELYQGLDIYSNSNIELSISLLNFIINQKTNKTTKSEVLQILEKILQFCLDIYSKNEEQLKKPLVKKNLNFGDRVLNYIKKLPYYIENLQFFMYIDVTYKYYELYKNYTFSSLSINDLLTNQDLFNRFQNILKSMILLERNVNLTNLSQKASFIKYLASCSLILGNYRQAENLYKKALKIYQKNLGKNDTYVAEIYNELGNLYSKKKQYRQAEKSYKQCLEIWISLFSESHIAVANSLINLAEIYSEQKLYDQAKSNLIKSLEIKRNKLDNNHIEIAEILCKLANLYELQKDFDQAEIFYLECLEIYKYLQQNDKILDILVRIGTFYQNQCLHSQQNVQVENKPFSFITNTENHEILFQKAESYSLQVLDIWKNDNKLFGFRNQSIDIDTDIELSNLLCIYRNLCNLISFYSLENKFDKFDSLIPPLIEIIEIIEQFKTKKLTTVNKSRLFSQFSELFELFTLNKAGIFCCIGLTYYRQQKYSKSNFYYTQSLEAVKQLYQNNLLLIKTQIFKETVNNIIQSIALLYMSKGLQFSKKEIEHIDLEILLKGLEISKRCLGAKHESTISILCSLAIVYQVKQQYKEAENYCLQTLNSMKGFFPRYNTNQFNINILTQLAIVYQHQSRFKEAESLYIKAGKIIERLSGKESLSMAINLNNLGTLYRDQGLYDQAESYLTQALDLQKRLGKDNDDNLARCLDNLGMVYFGQKRYKEAESLYLQALEIFERDLKNDDPRIIRCRKNIEEVTKFID